MHFPSYGQFVAVMGYCPADETVIDTGGLTVWRVSQNGNPCRFSDDGNIRVTVCKSKNGAIGYVWNRGAEQGWKGPFASFDDAINHADANVF